MKRAGRESLITIDAWEKRLQACGLVLLGCLLFAAGGAAQGNEGVKKPLTLEDAVNYALQHYPAVRASLEQVNAAEAKVALTRTQYLPQLNGVYAISRATQNQVEGVWLPTPITPTVEGPQGPSSSASYWGSQAAALFSWEPLDFGLRSARVGEARAGEEKSRAELALTRLQVATAVGRYFFLAMANQEASKAAQANVDRWGVFARSTHVLVDNELRPGADASRANAELARAKTQLYQAQEGEREALDTLAALMGTAGTEIQLDGSALLDMPVNEELPEGTAADHPIVREQMASVKVAQAQERTVDKSNYPRLFLQGEGFARGSGVESNGAYVGNWNGRHRRAGIG
jgi:outer membrane protein TolC